MSAVQRWKSKGLDCWGKAKEIRANYWKRYAEAKEKGQIRWTGGSWNLDPIAKGFGDEVVWLTSESYGAEIGYNPEFSRRCQEEVEKRGFARDLCAYLRNYWGSMFLNEYAAGGEFPKPDFCFQTHICCSHAKWYQVVSEHEGVPLVAIDCAVGPPFDFIERGEELEHRVRYVAEQSLDAIEQIEKITGRKFDDEKFIEAVYQEQRATSLWAEICVLNQAVPAPLDEKTIYALYSLLVLHKASKEVADFYEYDLKPEVEDRVRNKIAAVATERFRVIHDGQPPWSFLKLFRYLEQYGVVCVGSFYTFTLMGSWDFKDGRLTPPKPVDKSTLKTREDAAMAMARWRVTTNQMLNPFHVAWPKIEIMLSIVRDWKAQGAIVHYNRGCEGLSMHVAECRLALSKAGIPTCVYEGNMADDREFDEVAAMNRIDAFMESLGLQKLIA